MGLYPSLPLHEPVTPQHGDHGGLVDPMTQPPHPALPTLGPSDRITPLETMIGCQHHHHHDRHYHHRSPNQSHILQSTLSLYSETSDDSFFSDSDSDGDDTNHCTPAQLQSSSLSSSRRRNLPRGRYQESNSTGSSDFENDNGDTMCGSRSDCDPACESDSFHSDDSDIGEEGGGGAAAAVTPTPNRHRLISNPNLYYNKRHQCRDREQLININHIFDLMSGSSHPCHDPHSSIGPTMDDLNKVLSFDLHWILSTIAAQPQPPLTPSSSPFIIAYLPPHLTSSSLSFPSLLLSTLHFNNLPARSKIKGTHVNPPQQIQQPIFDHNSQHQHHHLFPLLGRLYTAMSLFLAQSNVISLLDNFINPCLTPLLLAIQHMNYFATVILLQQRFEADKVLFRSRCQGDQDRSRRGENPPHRNGKPTILTHNTPPQRYPSHLLHPDLILHGFEDEIGSHFPKDSSTIIVAVMVDDCTMIQILCDDLVQRMQSFK